MPSHHKATGEPSAARHSCFLSGPHIVMSLLFWMTAQHALSKSLLDAPAAASPASDAKHEQF